MSLLADVKFLLKKYLKNPVLVAMGGYLLWRFVQKHKKKEGFIESIKVIEDNKKYQLIFDSSTNKYILYLGGRVFSAANKEDLLKMV
jgi:hypothetical protein